MRLEVNSGCSFAWMAYLRDAGCVMTEEVLHAGLLVAQKAEKSVPLGLQACHTRKAGADVFEAHVPAAYLISSLSD